MISWLAVAWCCAAATFGPTLDSGLVGSTIYRVQVTAPEIENPKELLALIEIQPGYRLQLDDIQRSLKRLYALGRFSDVRVVATPFGSSVSLEFLVRGIHRLDALRFEGLDEIERSALRRALVLGPGDEVDSQTASLLREKSKEYLRRRGFPQAQVAVTERQVPDTLTFEYVLNVDEGAPARLKNIVLSGEPRLPRNTLLEELDIEIGDRADEVKVSEAISELRKRYRNRGFLNVSISEPEYRELGKDRSIEIAITAGARYGFLYRGNWAIREAELRATEPDRLGERVEEELSAHAEKIRTLYVRRGFSQAKVHATWHLDRTAQVYRVVFNIDEGIPFSVSEILFEGAKHFDPEDLKSQLEIFLADKLEENGVFEALTRDERLSPAGVDRSPTHKRPKQRAPKKSPPTPRRWVPELYEAARQEIQASYQDQGFLKVGITGPSLQRRGRVGTVRFLIDEGERCWVKSIAFRGNDTVNATELLGAILSEGAQPLKPNGPFSQSAINRGRIAIIRAYRNLGYLYARVVPRIQLNNARTRGEVAFEIDEGPQVRIGQILIRGNRFTRETVIRARLSLKPGGLYRVEQALGDQRNISALDVFRRVRVRLIDEGTPGEQKDVVVEVEEQDRRSVDVKMNLTSARGAAASVRYAHRNIFGTASTFTTSVALSRRIFFAVYRNFGGNLEQRYQDFSTVDEIEREVRLGLQSPQFFSLPGRPSIRGDILHEREITIPYSLNLYTLILGIDLRLAQKLALSIEPQFSLTQLECQPGDGIINTTLLCNDNVRGQNRTIDAGLRRTFKIGPTVTLDWRDDPFNPRRGSWFQAGVQYGVGVFTDADTATGQAPFAFTRVQGTWNGYLPLGPRLSFAVSFRAGRIFLHNGPFVPADERFYLGGGTSLRGFVQDTVIAEDQCVVRADDLAGRATNCTVRNGDAPPEVTGGQTYGLVKSELRIPVGGNVSLGIFLDAGNLWRFDPSADSMNLRFGTGAGIRYGTPVGPLALDLAFNPDPRRLNGEVRQVVHFSIGVF